MEKEQLIKKAKQFGRYGSHIILRGKDKEKQFIVLPIQYRFILNDLLKKIDKELKKPLKKILTVNEINQVRDSIGNLIEDGQTLKDAILNKAYKDYYAGIETLEDSDDLKNVIYMLSLRKGNKKIIDKIKGFVGLEQ